MIQKLSIGIFIFFLGAGVFGQKNAESEALTLRGQVVCCQDCWAEEDRTKIEFGTAEDLLKAKSCVEGGDPTLLAVRNGEKFSLYRIKEGKFRLTENNWLSFVGKTVEVVGARKKEKNAEIFIVDSLRVLQESIGEREAKAAIGQEVALRLNDLSGTEQDLAKFKGRIVVLNFWATYCEPCKKEMPDLAAIQNEFAALGIQVIGASADDPGDRTAILEFIKDTKVNFPIWLGATAADMRRFGLGEALPGTVVVDKTGKIAKVLSGVVNAGDLRREIESMLNNPVTTMEKTDRAADKINRPKPSEVSSVPS